MCKLLLWILFITTFFPAGYVPPPSRYDVVIDEIMADPSPAVALPGNEWIELKNTSPQPVDLAGWRIRAGNSLSGAMPSYILKPDSFVIICTSSAVAAMSVYGAARSVTSFPSLNNSGDVLTLLSSSGAVIHSVQYSDKWYGNELKKDGGWTLEMIDTKNACSGAGNWKASVDPSGGTPGRKNTGDAMNADVTPPRLMRSYATSPTDITLVFDESLDSLNATTVAHYAINNGIGVPIVATPVSPLFNLVRLKLSSALQPEKIYSVKVNGITDCAGNSISDRVNEIMTAMPGSPARFDLVINEILFNPVPECNDYVEIYNRSAKPLNLADVSIANRNTTGVISNITKISNEPKLIFPGTYALLTADASVILKHFISEDPAAFHEVSLPSYNDDKGYVILLDTQGNIIDEVDYSEKWHFPLLGNKEGVALERISFSDTSLDRTLQQRNWHSAAASVGYGTPGYKNSQGFSASPNDRTIVVEPSVISPDNDGRDDFAIIRYSFPTPGNMLTLTIFDAAGRKVRDLQQNVLCGRSGYFRWDGLGEKQRRLSPGLYIIHAASFDLSGKTTSIKKTIVLAEKK